jgi:hypothetical protein
MTTTRTAAINRFFIVASLANKEMRLLCCFGAALINSCLVEDMQRDNDNENAPAASESNTKHMKVMLLSLPAEAKSRW